MTEATATKATAGIWEELRKPFPEGTVGSLPKPYKKDSPKGKCTECGGFHGLPAMHLDYVGHAAVTDRLNTVVGPENWSLEPMAVDEFGNPKRNDKGELWCWLTILGAKKMCVGDEAESSKELIGDALRNGAMRFGIALDLWTKDELESTLENPELKNDKPSAKTQATQPQNAPQPVVKPITEAQVGLMSKLAEEKLAPEQRAEFAMRTIGKTKPENSLEASKLINAMLNIKEEQPA